jgi:hypothetical protein
MLKIRHILVFAALLMLLATRASYRAQDRVRVVVGSSNNQMRVVNTYPEYWVDGEPFFQYAGSFFYYRLPRDRWAEEILALKAMGLNTLDVLPMWNWHEPEEGQTDYDGHTNPRRDLKYVFELADSLGMKITLRPGPYDTNEWRNGGYPDWLLSRPEYRMSQQAILEGRYPRWSALQYQRSEVAATEWLKNDTHLKYSRKYYQDVLGLSSPFFADRGGPILSLQMDDDQAIGAENYNGTNLWKYMDTLRKFAKQATDDRPLIYFIDGEQMRLNAEANDALPEPFWNQGQDYSSTGPVGYSTPGEAAKNKFLLELLKTQPLFIPAHIEFQAGWWPGVDDTFARLTDASNTLMASRVMFQNGLKGLSYFPPNDTINPAGYTVPWSNHFYVWEAALNLPGNETPRAVYVRRNGRLVAGMGPLLASAHLLPDAGVVYPMATFPQEALTGKEALHIVTLAGRLLWAGAYEHCNFELVDSDHAPLENFQRYRILFAPNVVNSKEELKRYPHLGRYSEKAQQMLSDYASSGGTLIIFPSLPKGKIFDSLLEPLGADRQAPGDSVLKFSDGTASRALDFHSVLTLPKKPHAEVKVFARDAHGGIVGARLAHGKGQIIFFGADFSTWSLAAGTEFMSEGTQKAGAHDYPEETQQAARLALPALLKEAGGARKVYPEMKTEKARDLGLYVTELVADAGSLPFEKRSDANGFGFVGVTNFSVEQARRAEIVVTDPRARDLAAAPQPFLRLPGLTLPPRESLLLPVRVPLANPYGQMAPGLEPGDEVFYATAELSQVSYDGAALKLDCTVPSDGEVALRLSRRPERATLDGQPVAIQEDAERRLYVVKMARGQAPHFLRKLELAYPHEGPRLTLEPRDPWIAGETRAVRVRVENPCPTTLGGELDLVAGSLYRAENPPLEVHIPSKARREFSFPVEIPAQVTPNQPIDLTATLRERDSANTWAWHAQVVVHRPFDFSVGPTLAFPLREDVPLPIVHPTLASVELPGEAVFQVRVKNWQDYEQVVTVEAAGNHLALKPALTQLVLPAGADETLEIHAAPQGGSGTYRLTINLRSGSYQASEEVVIAALAKGEAIAYTLDYDRDGFPDVILENSALRLFVSPYDGGRAYAFVSKATGANAFNSVGGMRDNFTKRAVPEDLRDLPGWTKAEWLGLFNRPYTFRIVSAAGAKAAVHLEYSAPDIYPQGVKVERTLTLQGDASYYLEESALTPAGVAEPQSYVLENSVTFKMFDEPENFRRWFAQGHPPEEFVADKNVDLPAANGFVGALNKQTGEIFALLSLSPLAKSQLAVHAHAATIRLIYPDFSVKNQTCTYRAAYFFGKATGEEVQGLYMRLKSGRE